MGAGQINTPLTALPTTVQEVLGELLPLLKQLELGRYAIALSGSRSKGTWDERSDLDPHIFYERDNTRTLGGLRGVATLL